MINLVNLKANPHALVIYQHHQALSKFVRCCEISFTAFHRRHNENSLSRSHCCCHLPESRWDSLTPKPVFFADSPRGKSRQRSASSGHVCLSLSSTEAHVPFVRPVYCNRCRHFICVHMWQCNEIHFRLRRGHDGFAALSNSQSQHKVMEILCVCLLHHWLILLCTSLKSLSHDNRTLATSHSVFHERSLEKRRDKVYQHQRVLFHSLEC